jgi:quercetin dioxygenase-like cupin family protein
MGLLRHPHRLVAVCVLLGCGSPVSTEPAGASASGGEQPGSETLASAGETAAAAPAGPVDPLVASPDVFKVILDGPRARVLHGTWQPGQRDNMHGHPTLIVYAVTPIFGIAHGSDESQESIRLPQGRVLKQAPVPAHAFQNNSTDVAQMIIVELKPDAKKVRPPKDAVTDALAASPEVFELMAFDSEARVLIGTWQPGQKDALHSHPAVTAYAITDVQGRAYDEAGKVIQEVSLKAGTALFLDPVKAHQFENTGSAPAQLLIVEQRR